MIQRDVALRDIEEPTALTNLGSKKHTCLPGYCHAIVASEDHDDDLLDVVNIAEGLRGIVANGYLSVAVLANATKIKTFDY